MKYFGTDGFRGRVNDVLRLEHAIKIGEYLGHYYKGVNPNAKIVITGYADKNTGNAVGNKSLSERRAATVADALNKQYGIDRSRMIIDSKGDTVQPFNEEVKNRVTICIAE
jgi:outer membrane protein OmpA-like peptidoglycan-associated protein